LIGTGSKKPAGRACVCEEGVVRMLSPEGGVNAVVVASEPLDPAGEWTRIQPNHLVIVPPECAIEHRPMDPS